MSEAAIQLLRRRWNLPEAAVPVIERFFASWADGHTSLELTNEEVKLLSRSAAVSEGSDGGNPAPLVLRDRRLQSWVLAQAEIRVAVKLRELASVKTEAMDTHSDAQAYRDVVAQLFPDQLSEQHQVATLGLGQALTLVTGGPGTGKTTTAAKLLTLLVSRQSSLRIALSAPTGKAANRLGEAMGQAAMRLTGQLAGVRPRLEQAAIHARTIHRLLGWNPKTNRCRFHAGNPLPYDVVVVDEASMLDLMLWDRLLCSLGQHTKLIVLGDHHQLESVQPGRVMAEMIAAAQGGALTGCHVELVRNYRFATHHPINHLAAAVRHYDGDAAVRVLTNEASRADLAYYPSDRLMEALDQIWPAIKMVVTASDPGAALAALARVRILCALSRGPYGVEGINALVDSRLRQEGLPTGQWAHGRPVLVTANDPHSGLFNGALGVVLNSNGDQGATVWFDDIHEPRGVPITALRSHETAWAMTVHRSQGSEFESVLVVLPPEPHKLCGPELLYTAVTRAKSKLLVAADDDAILAACLRRPARRTELLRALNARPHP
ncbi:MAG: exodeoxyribonuclease V subunit alpha [Acidobacteriota bacterium]|nr:exodeoxyribonuclease V subunit alpha [Acidobacteriota bacterium]